MRTCPYRGCGALIARGRYCQAHRGTTFRGYGAAWQQMRASLLAGAVCAVCGTSERLQLDHRVPRSLGGTDSPANLRPLCANCHARLGVRSNANR